MCYNDTMKIQISIFSLALLTSAWAGTVTRILETEGYFKFGPGEGKEFTIALKPEWGVLTVRTRIKTTDLECGKRNWMNGRVPMSFHGKDGKMVGGWPNVFGFSGTRDWTDCERDFVIPRGATRLDIGMRNFGKSGTAEYGRLTVDVKRNYRASPWNAPLPKGAPADPWSLDDAWKISTAARTRWSMNGLWGLRPALTNDAPDVVPGPNDNWGWGKIPSVLSTPYALKTRGQEIFVSEWFEDHGVVPDFYHVWYRRDFTMPAETAGRRTVLTFTMLNTRAVVYVDGKRAAEVMFPGGEADITTFVRPGKKQSIILDVTTYPLNPETLEFNAPDRASTRKSEVRFKGVTGDLYLDVMPKATPRIAAATAEPDVAGGRIAFAVDTEGLGTSEKLRLVARVYDTTDMGKVGELSPIKEFSSGDLLPDADGRISFSAGWADAKRWDIDTPGNRYVCAIELRDQDGRTVDAALPFSFGFRSVRLSGRNMLLNEIPIHLRALYNSTMNAAAGTACRASALEMCRRLKKDGFNFIIAGNYNFSPGAISYMDALLEACDETGMLFSFSLPHVRDYDFHLDRPEVAARFKSLTRWAISRARNHPCVITYAMNHNCTGYIGDMNPLRIDGIYEMPNPSTWAVKGRSQAVISADIVRSIDATRPIYHHESGNLGDFHTVNIYLDWAPIQERSDWLEHWSEKGIKPLFFVEWGMPHISSWSSYRGPLFIWRNAGFQSLWASEFAAAFRGDAAYEGDTPEAVAALANEERLWAKGQPFFWAQLNIPLRALTNNYQGVQALYMSDNWRSHRAWGITAMLPWDQGDLHLQGNTMPPCENPERWKNLKSPGIVPDVIYDEGWPTGTGSADKPRSPIGEVLRRWNAPDCAFIGGDGTFTDKRHHFRLGETVRKTLVVLNDRRAAQKVSWTCELASHTLRGSLDVPAGTRRDVPVEFALPAAPGRFRMSASFEFEDGVKRHDSFDLESYATPSVTSVKGLLLYDPKGLTAREFDRLGIAYTRTDCAEPLTNGVALAVGRGSLTRDLLDRVLVPSARKQAYILVFEQDKATLESVGFRTQAYGLRNVFPRYVDPTLNGLDEAMLRDWNGEATLLTPHLEGIAETENKYTCDTWAGFSNPRVWRCRNRGNVASVIPEKPSVGDWRALVDGGFDLQYAPLLDWMIDCGRITFCQLDVTGRTVHDPVADDLVRRLVARLSSRRVWPKRPRAIGWRAWVAGRDLDVGIKQNPDENDSGLFIVSSGAVKPDNFNEMIEKGGKALCLGLTAEEIAAWSPVPLAVAETNGCYAARIEAPPPELNGLSNADWSWHGAMDFAAFKIPAADGNQAIRVVRYGKGAIIFWQVPPWAIDAEARPYLRTSRRRADAMLSRILGNMGCVSLTGAIRYSDVPIAEDDPYRYYRW